MTAWAAVAEWTARGLDAGLEAGVLGVVLLVLFGRGMRGSAPLAFAALAVGLLKFAIALLLPPGPVTLPLPSLGDAAAGPASAGWLATVAFVWAAGAIAQAARVTRDVVRLAALSRRARGTGPAPAALLAETAAAARALGMRAPEVLVSAETSAPFVCGLFRPLLIVPPGFADRLDRDALRLALLHELAHAKRGDLAWIGLASLLSVAWWWHPVFWLLTSRLRAAQEHVADDLALLAARGDEERYCQMLLGVAAQATSPARGAALAPAGLGMIALERRIRRLMDPATRRRAGLAAWQRAAIVLFAVLALPAAVSNRSDDLAASHLARHRAAHLHFHGH